MSQTVLRQSLEKVVLDVVEKNNKLSQEKKLEFYNKFKDKLAQLYEVVKELDAEFVLECEKAKVDAEEKQSEQFYSKLSSTLVDYPNLDVDKLVVKFLFDGVLYTENYCEYCYARDSDGHCEDDEHTRSYADELKIILDGVTVYHHDFDSNVKEMEHTDEKVYIRPNFGQDMEITVHECDVAKLSKATTDVVELIAKIHEACYDFYVGKGDTSNSAFRYIAQQGIDEKKSIVTNGAKKKRKTK